MPPFISGHRTDQMALAALTVVGFLSAACSSTPGIAPTPMASAALMEYTSPRFTFRHTALDAATIAQTAATLERESNRVMADLQVESMPRVVVTLYPDRAALRAAVAPLVGTIPSFAGGLITAVDAIHIVSPNASHRVRVGP